MNEQYLKFLERKQQRGAMHGFAPTYLPPFLKDFQTAMVDWSVRMGRGALFEDCGLGKTVQELVWAENVVRHTNRPVINFAPLAVTQQTMRESEKFGIEAHLSHDGRVKPGINIVNYEKIHLFDPLDFGGVVCDESGILKSFDGVRKAQITEFMRRIEYRLLATATAAPNDYTELGNSSEALGYLGQRDMLSRFFKNDQGNAIKLQINRRNAIEARKLEENSQWRFKGHAEQAFWRWVCSWARACRKPGDLGFSDDGYILPGLIERQHMVHARNLGDGMLLALPAVGLKEQRDERRRTIEERCEKAASLVNGTGEAAIVWCHLNPEGDLLEKLVPDCVQISGRDSDEEKEEKFMAFIDGRARVLVSKAKIGAWGLNFQHCAHQVAFPTHSWEEWYQQVRRCYRFGQKRPVVIDVVTTEGEKNILENLQGKARAADRMFSELVSHMNEGEAIVSTYKPTKKEEIPSWL